MTRQKAGRFGIAFPPGGVKLPAGMASAAMIVVSGSCRCASAPQSAASAGRAAELAPMSSAATAPSPIPFIRFLRDFVAIVPGQLR